MYRHNGEDVDKGRKEKEDGLFLGLLGNQSLVGGDGLGGKARKGEFGGEVTEVTGCRAAEGEKETGRRGSSVLHVLFFK